MKTTSTIETKGRGILLGILPSPPAVTPLDPQQSTNLYFSCTVFLYFWSVVFLLYCIFVALQCVFQLNWTCICVFYWIVFFSNQIELVFVFCIALCLNTQATSSNAGCLKFPTEGGVLKGSQETFLKNISNTFYAWRILLGGDCWCQRLRAALAISFPWC